MSTELTAQQVAKWLREQAAKYEEAAALVERNGDGQDDKPQRTIFSVVPSKRDHVTVEQLRIILAEKRMRLKTLADATGAHKSSIRKLLTADNGFVILDRGWIGLKDGPN